jgi:hypothetical protein
MHKTELNLTDEIHIISDQDLGAAVGGFQVYTGGGGGSGRVPPGFVYESAFVAGFLTAIVIGIFTL